MVFPFHLLFLQTVPGTAAGTGRWLIAGYNPDHEAAPPPTGVLRGPGVEAAQVRCVGQIIRPCPTPSTEVKTPKIAKQIW